MTRAFVVRPEILTRETARRGPASALAEAVSLVKALKLEVVGAEVATVQARRASTLLGAGKIERLGARFAANEVDLAVIDGAVTPIQQRNLERAWKVKVLDRTGLILEIFGERARTREGVLQVELAHLVYQKSRLVRSWTHLERQRGGVGFMGGPGETQIEADRRLLDERVAKLKGRLAKVAGTRFQHRKARQRAPYPVVALVGYTNSGKSTLFNQLVQAETPAKDMLFATLDPTMRGLRLPDGRTAILSDTVGFVADLPTQLVAAFRATLEEVLEADLVVHVRDASHPDWEAQGADVADVLRDLGLSDRQLEGMIEARNKIDRLDEASRLALLNETERADRAFAISALTGQGVEQLRVGIGAALGETRQAARLRLDAADGRALAWLYERGAVRGRHDLGERISLELSISDRELQQFLKTFPSAEVVEGDVRGLAAE